ncbi:putative pectinesterase 66 [Senna tora]|uniref:pectinesterase n=1 Tax=Senna tora TaxID=362788 RepID=A0A834TAR2_9FABA|nr:putative pectinesterase 66 [Senna tora]
MGPIKSIRVSQSGQSQFKTIQSAINTVPMQNSQWTHIQIAPGIYREMVTILKTKNCIYLEGASSNLTIVESDGHMDKHLEFPTLNSRADNTVAKGITFKNTYNDPALRGDENHKILPALAARVQGDKCAFIECAFLGVQDTVFDRSGRHYFHKCYIQGGIDFIFGDARSMYDECTIMFSMGKEGPKDMGGVITANKRSSPKDESGFVLKNSNITGNGIGKLTLGRGYGEYSRVIIANSFLGDVVSPQGWVAWNGASHEGNLTYVEEGCTGPGADKSKRVPWMKHLSGNQLQQFTDIKLFIDPEGWISKLPIQHS